MSLCYLAAPPHSLVGLTHSCCLGKLSLAGDGDPLVCSSSCVFPQFPSDAGVNCSLFSTELLCRLVQPERSCVPHPWAAGGSQQDSEQTQGTVLCSSSTASYHGTCSQHRTFAPKIPSENQRSHSAAPGSKAPWCKTNR